MFTSASKKMSSLDGPGFRVLEGDTRLGKGNGKVFGRASDIFEGAANMNDASPSSDISSEF